MVRLNYILQRITYSTELNLPIYHQMTLYLHKFFHYLTSFYGAGNVMLGLLSLFSSMLLETGFAAYNILCQVRFFPTI